jgi:hypothetical protein
MKQPPRVSILMGVLNGAAYLPEQLQSIASQQAVDWRLIVSDDGSSDASTAMIDGFHARFPRRVTWTRGPGQGFATNYLHLLRNLPPQPGFVAFADQDDLWLPDKLARGLGLLDSAGAPQLYCGRRWIWKHVGGPIQATPAPARPPSFRNALVENIAGGNTILLNPAAAKLLREAARGIGEVFAHDWWSYLLITGSGGRVIFDKGAPRILYRQHATNALGAGCGLRSWLKRKSDLLNGQYAARIEKNLSALNEVRHLLIPENAELLRRFASARQQRLRPRIRAFRAMAPYRQSRLSSFGLWGALALGRI